MVAKIYSLGLYPIIFYHMPGAKGHIFSILCSNFTFQLLLAIQIQRMTPDQATHLQSNSHQSKLTANRSRPMYSLNITPICHHILSSCAHI